MGGGGGGAHCRRPPPPPATSSCVLIVLSFVSFQVLPLILQQDTNIHMLQRQRKVTGLITVPIAVFVWCFISHCSQPFPTQWACVLTTLHNFCHCNQFCSPLPKIAWLTQSPIIPYLTIGFFKGYWKIWKGFMKYLPGREWLWLLIYFLAQTLPSIWIQASKPFLDDFSDHLFLNFQEVSHFLPHY